MHDFESKLILQIECHYSINVSLPDSQMPLEIMGLEPNPFDHIIYSLILNPFNYINLPYNNIKNRIL